MDRFIDEGISILENSAKLFKIQYGQIYSFFDYDTDIATPFFKIQYGQIYSCFVREEQEMEKALKSNMDRFIEVCMR